MQKIVQKKIFRFSFVGVTLFLGHILVVLSQPALNVPEYRIKPLPESSLNTKKLESLETLDNRECGNQKEVSFSVTDLVLVGNNSIPADKLIEVIGWRSGETSLCEQLKKASLLTQYYRNSGYFAAQVVIPAQDLTDKKIIFSVMEGNFDEFRVRISEGYQGGILSDELNEIKSLISSLLPTSGQIIFSKDVERTVLLVGERFNKDIRVNVYPGRNIGEVSLDFEVAPMMVSAISVSTDNYGSPRLGINQYGGQVAYNGLFFSGDRSYFSYLTSENPNLLKSYVLGYEVPLDEVWRLGIRTSRSQYILEDSKSNGNSASNGVYASYALKRSFESKIDWSLGFNRIDTSDIVGLGAIINPRHFSVMWSEIRGVARDNFLFHGGVSAWAVGLTRGSLTLENQQDTDGISGNYHILSYEISRRQSLYAGLALNTSLRGQVVDKNLNSYHHFSLGGVNGVRAFSSSEISGDIGYLARVELAYANSFHAQVFHPAIFYDFGKVKRAYQPTSELNNKIQLGGYGVQLEWFPVSTLKARVFWAKPVNSDQTLSLVDGKHDRVGFDVNYRF